ncbi:MAG: hypothetical protein ACK5MA_09230 [Parachlamydiaceae bacterium]
MGVVVNHQGAAQILTGNQIASLLLNEILYTLSQANKLPQKGACVKSIVTTDLFKAIAEAHHLECYEVLPGFKYIAQWIRTWESEENSPQFLFGAEESYGYLYGTQARDKDAIGASLLIAETALRAKLEGKTLVDLLHEIYLQYGIYHEEVLSVGFDPGKIGSEKMTAAMKSLRDNPPTSISGLKVESSEDFLDDQARPATLPSTNMLIYRLEGGSRLMVRPSGTEPKIKIYCGLVEKAEGNLQESIHHAESTAKALLEEFKSLLSS